MMEWRGTSLLIASVFFLLLGCEKDGAEGDGPPPGVGENAELYLQDRVYEELKVDLLYMDGHAPEPEAVDTLRSFLERHLRKPHGVDVETIKIPARGEGSYSVERIDEIISAHRRDELTTKRLFAYFLIVDGSFSADDGNAATLGVAYNANSMALFGETIREYSDEPTEPPRWKLEASVLNHEFGHILGLVDNGTPMVNDHRDGGNGHHCDDSDCLMYYSVETSDVVSMVLGSPIPDLDVECRKDLKANGGK